MSTNVPIASAFAAAVARNPELQHAAVRVGLWLVAAAEQQGEWPVDAHPFHFIRGLKRGKVNMHGIQFRAETVKSSIASLQAAGLLRVDDGETMSGGRKSKLYTMTLE